ncbi:MULTISPECIES: glucosaminidase domain-containing protein [unclassified Vibrio]|uniref:glucosaminidase domain-containing protein n=1 Tax=unclassified Vibrio TaxID=2614977 RepID=UPI001361F28D|nr:MULTISPECIES: glucosaminidase domain-containing protein [unclassified Vibrio]NAW60187.1 glucosaminidase [Vibrio sp. V36_P2S2PM302]NAX28445.1 glucosaminidase [Vibrio sp. V38_P2S17PM301]NAX29551.1 glucosaminidase [Vibrio sp. V37_P2S8PM304]
MHKKLLISLTAAGLIASCSLYYAQAPQESVSLEGHKVGEAPDFASIQDVTTRKHQFFSYLKPGIALENQRILKERIRLESIDKKYRSSQLTDEDTEYAKRLGKLYDTELPAQGVDENWLADMLHRVDVIPEALVLTQAANESAWGTSRFAREANNYFGQWCYTAGCGLVPSQRPDGMTHEVKKFRSAQQSIHGYFMNVNRNQAYHDLREIRYQLHKRGDDLLSLDAAMAMSEGLTKYSERGQQYVNDLRVMMRRNEPYWIEE